VHIPFLYEFDIMSVAMVKVLQYSLCLFLVLVEMHMMLGTLMKRSGLEEILKPTFAGVT